LAISASNEVKPLGKRLVEMGWRMGVVVPPLLRGVAGPLPEAGETTGEFYGKLQEGSPLHGFTFGFTGKPGTHLVICTQTCDIASDNEPVVEAMLVQSVTNPVAFARMRQSSRRFVLDADRGLLAISQVKTFIDKRLLLDLEPQPGCKDQDTQRAFARWVGGRYARGAYPDAFVEGVRRPMFAKLVELRAAGDARMTSLDACRLRAFPPGDELAPPPYDVDLFFVMPDDATEGTSRAAAIRADIASLAPILQGSLDPVVVSHFSWDAQPLDEMSAADFLDTDDLPFE